MISIDVYGPSVKSNHRRSKRKKSAKRRKAMKRAQERWKIWKRTHPKSERGWWSLAIVERSGWRCCVCGCRKRGAWYIHAHHLRAQGDKPGLAHDLGNGVCVCERCHFAYHDWYFGDISPETFDEFREAFPRFLEYDDGTKLASVRWGIDVSPVPTASEFRI